MRRLKGLRAIWHRWCARGWRKEQRLEIHAARLSQEAAANASLKALRHERRAAVIERDLAGDDGDPAVHF